MTSHRRQKILDAKRLLKEEGIDGDGEDGKAGRDAEGGKKKRKLTKDPNKTKRKYTFKKEGKPANPRKAGGVKGEVKAEQGGG
jgi:hypothetical protein